MSGVRRRLAFVAVLAAATGYLLRSAAEQRLRRLRDRRKTRHPRTWVLLPDEPHRYKPEMHWPGSCWCGDPEDVPKHQSILGWGAGR